MANAWPRAAMPRKQSSYGTFPRGRKSPTSKATARSFTGRHFLPTATCWSRGVVAVGFDGGRGAHGVGAVVVRGGEAHLRVAPPFVSCFDRVFLRLFCSLSAFLGTGVLSDCGGGLVKRTPPFLNPIQRK